MPKFKIKVENGKFAEFPKSFIDEVKKHNNRFISVEIKAFRSSKSQEQLGYLYGGIYKAFMDNEATSGHTVDFWHRYFKCRILLKGIDQEIMKIDVLDFNHEQFMKWGGILSIKGFNTKEMKGYIDDILVLASTDFGLYIPTPEEYLQSLTK